MAARHVCAMISGLVVQLYRSCARPGGEQRVTRARCSCLRVPRGQRCTHPRRDQAVQPHEGPKIHHLEVGLGGREATPVRQRDMPFIWVGRCAYTGSSSAGLINYADVQRD